MVKGSPAPRKDKKKAAKANVSHVIIPALMPKKLVERVASLTEEYLATIFYDFILQQGNHVGVFFPFGNEFKYKEKRWIGLTDPPIFYLITKIIHDASAKYVPTMTTAEKWECYTFDLKGNHPPFEDIVAVLHRKKFIRHWFGQELEDSLDIASEKYISENKELSKQTLKGSKGNKAVKMILESFYQVHSIEHLCTAWCFTDEFNELLDRFRKTTKKH